MNLYAYAGNNPLIASDPLGRRALTAGETGFLTPIYHNTVDYSSVDVDEGGVWVRLAGLYANQAVTVGNNIRFPVGGALADFSQGSVYQQSWLVHEVGHVYEYQTNPQYGAIPALFDRQYNYTLDASKSLSEYGWEQQPQILQDYFLEAQAGASGVQNAHILSQYEEVVSDYGLGLHPALSPGITNPPLLQGGGNAYFPGFSESPASAYASAPSSAVASGAYQK